jgi:hypothetical protein
MRHAKFLKPRVEAGPPPGLGRDGPKWHRAREKRPNMLRSGKSQVFKGHSGMSETRFESFGWGVTG